MNVSLVALSGLQASSTRLAASASNIANANSKGFTPKGAAEASARGEAVNTGYRPLTVQQSTIGSFGTAATTVSGASTSRPVFAPELRQADSDGMVAMPDVDPIQEAAVQIQARHAYRASLSTYRTGDEMDRALLDLKT